MQYIRDVLCLPSCYKEEGAKTIAIPRGKQRALLANMGLQGKVTLTSQMTEEYIRSEIRSAFVDAMGSNPSFPFTFLQTSGCGAKTLSAPSLSSSFQWSAQEVSRLGKTCFNILAENKLLVEDVKVCIIIATAWLLLFNFSTQRKSMWTWQVTPMMIFSQLFQNDPEFPPISPVTHQ